MLKQPTRTTQRGSHWQLNCGCSYLALLQVGFTVPHLLPDARCALTAPFHPYHKRGGLLSVALAVGLRPPGVTWHFYPRSPDFPLCKHSDHSVSSGGIVADLRPKTKQRSPLILSSACCRSGRMKRTFVLLGEHERLLFFMRSCTKSTSRPALYY